MSMEEGIMRLSVKDKFLFILVVLLLFCVSAGAESFTFSADNHTYAADVPDDYLIYISGSGDGNALLELAGRSAAEIDSVLEQLGSSVWGAHKTLLHQFWLSVKDRSAGLGTVQDGQSLPKDIVKSYFDGVAIGRGSYTVETYDGQDYYVFENGQSIFQNGINYYISTFFGHYEVALRWESGNGKRTEEDIAVLKDIIRSVRIEKGTDSTGRFSGETEEPQNQSGSSGDTSNALPQLPATVSAHLDITWDTSKTVSQNDIYALTINGETLNWDQTVESAARFCNQNGIRMSHFNDDVNQNAYSVPFQSISFIGNLELYDKVGIILMKAQDSARLDQISIHIKDYITNPNEAVQSALDTYQKLIRKFGSPTEGIVIFADEKIIEVRDDDLAKAIEQLTQLDTDNCFLSILFNNLHFYVEYYINESGVYYDVELSLTPW